MAAAGKKSVLFVCLGNICRSPMAEAVFAHMVKEKGLTNQWKIDSAATSNWEEGSEPDMRGQITMNRYGITPNHRARIVTREDFKKFDFVFGMDEENIRNLKKIAPKDGTAKIELLGKYDPEGVLIIEDPYYGEDEDFETVFQQCTRCCKAFLEEQCQA